MSWMPMLYVPAACLLLGMLSAWTLRNLARPAPWLGWFLPVFPFLLLAWCLARPVGPQPWAHGVLPLGGWRWVIPALLLLTALRWILEVSARRALLLVALHPDFCRPAGSAFLAWVDYPGLGRRMGLSPGRLPELRISRLADGAWTAGGKILLDAALVPEGFRPGGAGWTLPGSGLCRSDLGALLAHELAHVRARDPWKRRLFVLMGAFLPWEWIHGNRGAVAEGLSRFRPYRLLTRALAWAGRPLALGVHEARHAGEERADDLADQVFPGARDHLDRLRARYGQSNPGTRFHGRIPPWAAGSILSAVSCLLLAGAPGRQPLALAFGAGARTASLPQGWGILTQPGQRVDPLFAPGGARPGALFVKCPGGHPGPPPVLRALVRLQSNQVPAESRLFLEWSVLKAGPTPLGGDEVGLSITQSAMSARENMDPLTFYGLKGPIEVKAGWWTYRQEIRVQGRPDLEFLLLTFRLSPGRFTFRPPLLTLVHADGTVHPFPAIPPR